MTKLKYIRAVEAFGVSRQAVSKWESGLSAPSTAPISSAVLPYL